jgi:hypothetical protein
LGGFTPSSKHEASEEIAMPYGVQTPRCGSLGLRQELCARNIWWAAKHGFLYEHTLGPLPSVLYRADENGRHGNFYPASYRRILIDPGWRRRLAKTHTTARRHLLSHDATRCELDSCNSSDALLMNIFCTLARRPRTVPCDRSFRLARMCGLSSGTGREFP